MAKNDAANEGGARRESAGGIGRIGERSDNCTSSPLRSMTGKNADEVIVLG